MEQKQSDKQQTAECTSKIPILNKIHSLVEAWQAGILFHLDRPMILNSVCIQFKGGGGCLFLAQYARMLIIPTFQKKKIEY